MKLFIEKVLSRDQVERLVGVVASATFGDGRATATANAAAVKMNLQAEPQDEATMRAGSLLVESLRAHVLFERATQPRKLSQPLFSRYGEGMAYGQHLDTAIVARGGPLRADVAVTVFLNERADYDGGELVIDTGLGEERVKGGSGDCVIYPASTFHRVEPVTRGVRAVAVLWVQSMVRDPAEREILYDIGASLDYLDLTGAGGPYVERLRRSQLNLLRRWAEV